jgi:histidinol phosphatase-like PHP family hydrolase
MRNPEFEPCIPSRGTTVPAHPHWIHEVKQDGYRMIVERDHDKVRLITRNGYDWTARFPWIVEAARRQLLRRPGYDIDIEKVLRTCAKHDVAVEINAHPWRLDLDWRWHQAALEFGCMMSINPDAHSIPELDHMHWGVEIARKGGVPADRVLNAMTLPEILQHLKHRRRAFARAA